LQNAVENKREEEEKGTELKKNQCPARPQCQQGCQFAENSGS